MTEPFREDLPEDRIFRALAKALFLAAGLVVLVWFVHEIQQVLLLFVLALILGLALNAPVTWLEGKGTPRPLGTLVSFLAVAGVAGLFGWLVVPRLAQEIPTLLEEVPSLMQGMADRLATFIGDHPEVDRQLSQLVEWIQALIGQFWRLSDQLLATLVMTIFLIALTLYIVADPRPLFRAYIAAMPPHLRRPATRAFARASKMVVGWVASNVILGGIKAVSAFLFLTFMEVPGALLWSALSLFAALIPRVGFYLMSIPPVVVALSIDPLTALWVALFFLALSEILGNFIAPRIRKETMELNPVLLLFMTLAMAVAFGAVGVVIAPPVTGFLKAFYDEFYLARQPEDERMEERVEAIMRRSPEG